MIERLITCLMLISSTSMMAQQDSLQLFPWCQQDNLGLIAPTNHQFVRSDTVFYPKIIDSTPSLFAFEQYGLYGFKNELEEIVIPPSSEEVGIFRDGFVWTKLDHKRYLYLNEEGKPLLAYTFDRCHNFQNGLARVLDFNTAKGYRGYGYLNTSGEVIIPLIYQQAFDFVGDYAMVKDEEGWWIINRQGLKIIGPNEYLEVDDAIFSCKK